MPPGSFLVESLENLPCFKCSGLGMRISHLAHMLIRCSAATVAHPMPQVVTHRLGERGALKKDQIKRDDRNGEGDRSDRQASASLQFTVI